MTRHVVATVDELPCGTSKIVDVGGRSIGIFNLDGRLYALRNVCPHHGAPVCLGTVSGRMLPSRPQEYLFQETSPILRCPWHGYQFQLENGRSPIRPDTLRVKAYRVEREGHEVVLYV